VAVAFCAIVFLAAAPIVAYLMDWIGFAIAPGAVLSLAALVASGSFILFDWPPHSDRADTIGFAVIAGAIFTWLLVLAGPPYLPPGSGPDLVHHLALIDFIERSWQLPHDPNLAAAIGEMANYTPGVHLLAALAGAWTRTDGFHLVFPIVALTVAVKAGLIFLIARRLMPAGVPKSVLALAAVLLLFAPRDYFLGSFTHASYLAQVVSEMFVTALWLAVVVWSAQPSAFAASLIGLCGAAAFLTWPVAFGPAIVLAWLVIACRFDLSVAARLRHIAMATLPAALIAAIHARGRTGAAAIIAGAGYVEYPQVQMFGWWFLLPAAIGVAIAAFDRRSRSVALLAAAIALQMAALFVLSRRAGAARPYQALKTVYLAIYPLAVAGSLALARVVAIASSSIGKASKTAAMVLSSALIAALTVAAARSARQLPRHKPPVSEPLFQAGVWARANLRPECVDYVVEDPYTAYWLHIAVLRNARAAPRSTDDDTYVTEKEQVRWVEPQGLPYAIVQDFDGLPRDIRQNVDMVRRFGRAAVIKRRGPASCAP
jgi:hypothetical protein